MEHQILENIDGSNGRRERSERLRTCGWAVQRLALAAHSARQQRKADVDFAFDLDSEISEDPSFHITIKDDSSCNRCITVGEDSSCCITIGENSHF